MLTTNGKNYNTKISNNLDPGFITGFVDGEGSFFVTICESKTHKLGAAIQLCFSIAQHSRDKELMDNIGKLLGCGRLKEGSNKSSVEFVVTKFSDINDKI